MENTGFIVIQRKLLEWEWHDDPNTLALWIHILLITNWKSNRWHGIEIPRGSCLRSLGTLSEETGMSVRNVRTALTHLKTTGEVTTQSTRYGLLINVINYAKYQDIPMICDTQIDMQTDMEVTWNRHGSDMEVTTLEQSNKETKEQYIQKKNTSSSCSEPLVKVSEPEASVEALVLNDGTEWRPTFRDYEEFKRLYPSVDIDDQFRRMRAWLLTNPSRRKTKRGVMQFVNRWLSKAQDKPSQPKAEEKKGFSVF